jgi:hypothetical protein
MSVLHVVPPLFAPFLPAHTGHLHLLADSVLGVAVGVVVVGLYLAVLRWSEGDREGSQDDQHRNGERRSNR